jgi:hypothetical protein
MSGTAINLRQPPTYVEGGKAVRDAARGALMMEQGPVVYCATSATADTVQALFNVPVNTFIVDIICRKTEVANGSTERGSFTIGTSTDVDLFVATDPQMWASTVSIRMSESISAGRAGFITTEALTINAYVEPYDATAGKMIPYIIYRCFNKEI